MSFLRVGSQLLAVGGQLLRTAAVGGAVAVPPPVSGAALPTNSLAGHWDVAALPVGASYTLPAASGTSKVASVNPGNGTPKVMPRNAGALPGFYSEGQASNFTLRMPVILDYTITAATMPVAAGDLTVMMAWTRPNQRQVNSQFSNTPSPLLNINGTVALQLAGSGTGDALTLFPATSAVAAGSLPLRHTRGALVQFSASKVDVWLDDGTHLHTAVSNPLTLGATADLAFLANSQLIFHEAAVWNKVLTAQERADALSYLARWPMGTRRAANFFMIGQSNAALYTGSYSLTPRLSAAINYLTGCPTGNGMWSGATLTGGRTFNAGQGVYDTTNGRFLDPTGGGDPSTWPLGLNGLAYMDAVDSASQDDRDNTFAIWWFWAEAMSEFLTTSRKAEATAAFKRAFSLLRAKFGRTAAQLPVLVIDPLPYLTTEGCQIHREIMQDLVNDPTQNVHYMLAQSADAMGQADSWDPATGQETGPGDGGHRNFEGMLGYQRRMVAPMARAIIAAQIACGRPDVTTAIDPAIPLVGGPKIVAAHYEGTTYAPTGTVLVTLAHDGGSDLVVPLKAVQGVGWALMDGVSDTVAGTPGSPGVVIKATACARVSATQVRVTLASAPVHVAKAKIYYPYGMGYEPSNSNYATIGQGNAVTDNFASIVLPAGWKIGADLGAAEQTNNPVQATTYGVALT